MKHLIALVVVGAALTTVGLAYPRHEFRGERHVYVHRYYPVYPAYSYCPPDYSYPSDYYPSHRRDSGVSIRIGLPGLSIGIGGHRHRR